MAAIYRIKPGETESPQMDASAASLVALVSYFNGATPVQPAAEGALSISPDATGETFSALAPYGKGEWRYNGPVVRVRLSLAGVAGVTSASVFIWRDDESVETFPPGAFGGTRALTVQTYNECNVKNGNQFESASNTATLAAGASVDLIFTTGALPVIIKGRIVKFNGVSLLTRVFRGPTYTGGTITPYFNLNDRNPATGLAVLRTSATVIAPGTEFGAPTYDIGSTDVGNSSLSTYAVSGNERLLAANTTYLLRITNDSPSAQRVASYITWYEGGTDLPLRQ